MTDPEYYALIDQAIAHATERRQEALRAADVKAFKDWDYDVATLEGARNRKNILKRLELSKG